MTAHTKEADVSTQSNGQAAIEAIEKMTEEELAAWIAAGDYTSIGGVPISDDDARRVSDAVAEPEVAAYGMDMGFGLSSNVVLGSPSGPPGGPGHVPVNSITHRKAGKGQQEFLKITLTQVFVSSF